jgi:hypothetical protein
MFGSRPHGGFSLAAPVDLSNLFQKPMILSKLVTISKEMTKNNTKDDGEMGQEGV